MQTNIADMENVNKINFNIFRGKVRLKFKYDLLIYDMNRLSKY